MKTPKIIRRLTALLLCLCMLFSMMADVAAAASGESATGMDLTDGTVRAIAGDNNRVKVDLLIGSDNPLNMGTLAGSIRTYEENYLLGIAADFCVFLREDFEVLESDAEGRVAVGGDFIIYTPWQNYVVGTGDYMTHYPLSELMKNRTNSATIILGGELKNGELGDTYYDKRSTCATHDGDEYVKFENEDNSKDWHTPTRKTKTLVVNTDQNPPPWWGSQFYSRYENNNQGGYKPVIDTWGYTGDYQKVAGRDTYAAKILDFDYYFDNYLITTSKKLADVSDNRQDFDIPSELTKNVEVKYITRNENDKTGDTEKEETGYFDGITFKYNGDPNEKKDAVYLNLTKEEFDTLFKEATVVKFEGVPLMEHPVKVVNNYGVEEDWEYAYIIVNVESGDENDPNRYEYHLADMSKESGQKYTFINGINISNIKNQWNNNYKGVSSLLYNFSEAKTVVIGGNFQGTIFAPSADVTDEYYITPHGGNSTLGEAIEKAIDDKQYGEAEGLGGANRDRRGHLSGALIANSFKGGTEFGYRPYAGSAAILKVTGSLTLCKTVIGNVNAADKFKFKIELTNLPDSIAKDAATDEYKKSVTFKSVFTDDKGRSYDKDLTFTYGDGKWTAEVELYHSEKIKINDLPVDTKYTIIESEADGYTRKTSDDDLSGTITEGDVSNGIEENLNPEVKVYNDRDTGDLVVKKSTQGTGKKADDKFTFQITLDNLPDSVTKEITETETIEKTELEFVTVKNAGTSTETKGKIKFTYDPKNKVWKSESFELMGGETLKIVGLPGGATYEVEETDSNGYTTADSSNLSGNIVSDETVTASVTNQKDDGPHKSETTIDDITVTTSTSADGKTVNGPAVKVGETITYKITAPNNTDKPATVQITDTLDKGFDFVRASYNSVTLVNGGTSATDDDVKIDCETKSDGTIEITWTIDNVDAFTTVEVELVVKVNEKAAANGEVTNQASVGNVSTEKVVNSVDTGKLTIEKHVAGDTVTQNESFSFTLKLSTTENGRTILRTGEYTAVKSDGKNSETIVLKPGEDGLYHFELKHNERIIISGIPLETTYELTEDTTGKSYNVYIDGVLIDGEIVTGATGDITKNGEVVEVVNALDAVKTETKAKGKADDGKTVIGHDVNVGDTIEYEIKWYNTFNDKSTVTVTDVLDTGVDFVSASFDGYTLYADGTTLGTPKNFTIGYSDRTVTWTLNDREPLVSNTVKLVVRVNESALNNTDKKVVNNANVAVGNRNYQTNDVENKVDTGELKIRKTVIGAGRNVDDTFNFELTLIDANKNPLTGTYKISYNGGATYSDFVCSDGKYSFTLQDGQEILITGLPAGATYTVTEVLGADQNYDVKMNGKVTNSVTGVVAKGDAAAITVDVENHKDIISKKEETTPGEDVPVVLGQEITYTITWANNENEEKTLTIIDTLDSGVDFVSASFGGYTLNADGTTSGTAELFPIEYTSGTVTWTVNADANSSGTVTLVVKVNEKAFEDDGKIVNKAKIGNDWIDGAPENNVSKGNLVISKTVNGDGADRNKDFKFTLELYGPDGKTPLTGNYPYSITSLPVRTAASNVMPLALVDQGGTTTVHHGSVIYLKHGEMITISNLPAGAKYKVTETKDPGYDVSPEVGYFEGDITVDGAEARFENTAITGGFSVKKTVDGNSGETDKDFNFKVELSDKTITGTYGDISFANGVATFSLKHGETKVVKGLPIDITYTITESDNEGYVVSVTKNNTTVDSASGTIVKNQSDAFVFTNTKNTGDLKITKTVDVGDQTKAFTFTVTLNSNLTGKYGDMTFVDGVATVYVKHGETKTATGLPAGTTYTITEIDSDGYDVTVKVGGVTVTDENGDPAQSAAGTIPQDGIAAVEFVNTKHTGGLTVSKTVVSDTLNDDAEIEFTFIVSLGDTSINGTYGDGDSSMTFTNGVARFTLKHGESKTATGLPVNIRYTVIEENHDNFTSAGTGVTGAITKDVTVEAAFTNTRKSDKGDLTVTKYVAEGVSQTQPFKFRVTLTVYDEASDSYVPANISGKYGDMEFTNGVSKEFTLKHGESKTATGLPAGINYVVEELDHDGYTATVNGEESGTISSDGKTAVFVNSLEQKTVLRSIELSKTVVGYDSGDSFTFDVTLTNENDEVLTGTNYTVEYADGTTGSIVNGKGRITLKGGETAIIKGLPTDTVTKYIITEINESEVNNYIVDEETITGVVDEDNPTANVKFTNVRRVGSLTVSKTVTGTAGETDKEFHFTVELVNTKITGTYGDMEFINGVSKEFTLKHGESKTATNLPAGIEYRVIEKEANENDYETTYTGNTGTIGANEVKTAAFENHKDAPDVKTGNLTVKKIVTEGGDRDKEFTFTVTLKRFDETTQNYVTAIDINEVYGEMAFANGVATFTLKHNEQKKATNLPDGIKCVIREVGATGYTTEYSAQEVIIDAENGNDPVIVTNKKKVEETKPEPETVSLTVNKTVVGEETEKYFEFTVTLSDASINGIYGNMTFVNGVAEFALKNGQSSTATGLPKKDVNGKVITYIVTESNNSGYNVKIDNASGSLNQDIDIIVNVTNTKKATGSLTVRKTVSGTAEGIDQEYFVFTVTLSDKSLNGPYGDMVFTNGAATFALMAGQSATATGLPTGITYEVTENNSRDYTVTTIGDTKGTITADGKTVTFNNHLDLVEYGRLNVTKLVTGNAADPAQSFKFRVTLKTYNEESDSYDIATDINGVYGNMTFTEGVAEFYLKHGENRFATNLPVGTQYTVEEIDYKDYTPSSTVEEGYITPDTTSRVVFTNRKDAPDAPALGNLTVKKTVTGTAGDQTKDFTFTVELSDKTINGKYGDMTFENGEATFTLKHGESKTATGLPAGITYTVTESDNDGYTMSETNASDTISANETITAEFVNHKDKQLGNLTVKKTVTGTAGDQTKDFTFTVELSDKTINGKYGDMTFENGEATFTLKHGESKTATGLPEGVEYTVIESENGGYNVSETDTSGTISANGTATAEFVNHKDKQFGDLTVKKTVTGTAGDQTKYFTFTVELSDKTINGKYGDMTFENGRATFELKHNESKTAKKLPDGITYKVTESGNGGYEVTSTGEEGTIIDGTPATASFVNHKDGDQKEETKTGELTVKKTVTGTAGDQTKYFTFTVELSDKTINGKYGDMTFENGRATFKLKHNESKTAKKLPDGITYKVTESGNEGYEVTSTGEEGTIIDGTPATASFVNHKDGDQKEEPKTGSLIVRKTVAGNAASYIQAFSFTVILSDQTINGQYGGMTFINGVAFFSLRHGESVTATGLPVGISYQVIENDSGSYIVTSTGSSGTIVEGQSTADFINFLNTTTQSQTGGLRVTKTVAGDDANYSEYFYFVVRLTDPRINGQYGEMYFQNGVSRFTLRHGESVTAYNLPAGIGYAVIEEDALDYIVTATGEVGTILSNGIVTAAFVNTKDTYEEPVTPSESIDVEEEPENIDDDVSVGEAVSEPGTEVAEDVNPATGDYSNAPAPFVSMIIAGLIALIPIRKRRMSAK